MSDVSTDKRRRRAELIRDNGLCRSTKQACDFPILGVSLGKATDFYISKDIISSSGGINPARPAGVKIVPPDCFSVSPALFSIFRSIQDCSGVLE